jgi:oxygen-dependent protoporphyrinogen oxidase
LNEPNEKLIERARWQLGRVLGPLPHTVETVVRRWPLSLPQYSVGHLDRMAEMESMLAALPTLRLVGSAYYGVGLPDLVRQGRSAARSLSAQLQHVAN